MIDPVTGMPEFLVSLARESEMIPIRLREDLDGIYLIQEPLAITPWGCVRRRPEVAGSTTAFGALFAHNLADAYRPEGIP